MSAASTVLTEKDQTEPDALLARLYTSTIGALELFHVFLGERRYRLPPGHAEVLTDGNSINFFAPMGRALVSIGVVMPNVLEAVRAGGGVPTRHTEKTCAARSPLSTALGFSAFWAPSGSPQFRCRSPTRITATCSRGR